VNALANVIVLRPWQGAGYQAVEPRFQCCHAGLSAFEAEYSRKFAYSNNRAFQQIPLRQL
jgi:hypothetical protein